VKKLQLFVSKLSLHEVYTLNLRLSYRMFSSFISEKTERISIKFKAYTRIFRGIDFCLHRFHTKRILCELCRTVLVFTKTVDMQNDTSKDVA
jgi:RNase P subunit RPR2